MFVFPHVSWMLVEKYLKIMYYWPSSGDRSQCIFWLFLFVASVQKLGILGIIVALIFRWILAQVREQIFVHIRIQNDYFLINSVSPYLI